MKYILFFILIASFTCLNLTGQFAESEAIEHMIEEIAENSDEETDYTSLAENLAHLLQYPIPINSCSYEDLAQLSFLTDFQIKSLLDYVLKKGPIVSVYEIQYIYGFDIQLVKWLIPFVTLETPVEKEKINKNIFRYSRNDLFITYKRGIEKSKGFEVIPDSVSENTSFNRYLGNQNKMRLKYTLNAGNKIFAGVQAENDPGEELFKGNNKSFDFISGYVQLKDIGRINNLIVGDYNLQFGQGLTLWNGISIGKGQVYGISKFASGIKKYGSGDENNFFRGMAGTISLKNISFTAFLSHKKIDANITDTIQNNEYVFSSFLTSGYHRTPAENSDENTIKETVAGTNISFGKENYQLGITLAHIMLNGEYNPAVMPWNIYSFRGSSLTNLGFDYRYRVNKVYFFGEISNGNGNWATLNGVEMNVHSLISFSLLYRNYSREFFAYRNNPFSEYSSKNNEKGTYLGTTILPYKNFKISAFVDVFKSPWLRYNVSSPSFGKEYFIQVDYNPFEKMSVFVRFKKETKSKNISDEKSVIPYLTNYSVNKTRVNLEYHLSSSVKIKTRFDWTFYEEETKSNEHGIAIVQDVVIQPLELPFSLWLRYCRFKGDSFDSRVYTYENSVPYSFYVPSFFNNGMRMYMMLRYKLMKNLSIWVKYGNTYYYNQENTGTGLNEVNGNVKSEIEAFLRFSF